MPTYEAQVEIKVVKTYVLLLRTDAAFPVQAEDQLRHHAMGLTEYQIQQQIKETADEGIAYAEGPGETNAEVMGKVEEVEETPEEIAAQKARIEAGEDQAWAVYATLNPDAAERQLAELADEE